jgi:hypothetical protein
MLDKFQPTYFRINRKDNYITYIIHLVNEDKLLYFSNIA